MFMRHVLIELFVNNDALRLLIIVSGVDGHIYIAGYIPL